MNKTNCPHCNAPLVKRGNFMACPNWKISCKGYTEKVQYTKEVKDFSGYQLFDVTCKYEHKEGSTCPSCQGKFSPSTWQDKIIRFVMSWKYGVKYALMIPSVAGSGKTTLLSELTRYISREISIGVVSFAKKNANDFNGKFPAGVWYGTHHSLLLSDWKRVNPRGKLEIDKKKDILYSIVNDWDKEAKKEVLKHMGGILSCVSGLLTEELDLIDENIGETCERLKIAFNGNEEKCIYLVKMVYTENERLSRLNIVDFDDLLVWGSKNPGNLTKFDYLFIDEYQDTNTLQRKVYASHVRYSVVMVGDKNQGIYMWRGASINAMEEGAKMFDARILSLALSYRLTKSGARYINENLPERYYTEVPTWAKEGELNEEMSLEDFYQHVSPGSLVLSRYNAPLVKPCLQLIAQGINAVILGKDFSEQLINLVIKIKDTDFWGGLADYVYTESLRLRDARKESSASLLEDKHAVLIALGEGCKDTGELITRIQKVFSDYNGQITFSTIHKAKGAESDKVYILDRFNLISSKAITEDEIIQEENALYVALSRSKDFMAFVPLPKK